MFSNAETQAIIEKKLLPVLDELARAEFGVYSMAGNIDDRTVLWMREGRDNIEFLMETYIDGLLEAHIAYGEVLMRKNKKAVRQGETDSNVKVRLEIIGKKRAEGINAVVSEEQAEMLLEMLDRFTDH